MERSSRSVSRPKETKSLIALKATLGMSPFSYKDQAKVIIAIPDLAAELFADLAQPFIYVGETPVYDYPLDQPGFVELSGLETVEAGPATNEFLAEVREFLEKGEWVAEFSREAPREIFERAVENYASFESDPEDLTLHFVVKGLLERTIGAWESLDFVPDPRTPILRALAELKNSALPKERKNPSPGRFDMRDRLGRYDRAALSERSLSEDLDRIAFVARSVGLLDNELGSLIGEALPDSEEKDALIETLLDLIYEEK